MSIYRWAKLDDQSGPDRSIELNIRCPGPHHEVPLAEDTSQTTYTYQGNSSTVTDPAGKWKQYANDALGNLATVLEPDPTANPVPGPPASPPAYPVTAAPTGMLLTSYAYDQVNHLTQVAMPRNTANGMVTQTRTFVYDPTTQRLTSATNPENGTVSYTYNADGTLATKKDANGNTGSYTYDTYGRLTAIPDRGQTFTYDTCPANDSFRTSTPGQLVEAVFGSMVGPNELSFQYDYTYTPAGKVASKALTLQSANHLSFGGQIEASGTLTASCAYDNQGALTSLAYPAAYAAAYPTITYTLDAMERPTGNGYASGATYNAANQPLYDGTSTRTYNSLLQVQTVTGPGMNMTYKYSSTQNNGQITSSVDWITRETVTYKYDALKRLLQAGGTNWVENYVYDGYGNLTQMNPTGTASGMPSMNLSIALDANNVPNNRILGATYDQNGNLIVAAGVVNQYDVANRLSEGQTNGNNYYGYDSDNRRIYYRDNNNNETIYFYGADGQKLATYTYNITNNGNPQIQFTQQRYNVYFLGKLILAEGTSVATDRLGSVRSGGPGGLGYQAQYPYGVEYTLTANDREKYATYTRDSLTGLDYATNRYYSSQWGRFLSPDPYPKRVGNRYAYAHNDPVNNNDPTGLDPCDAKTSDDQGDGDCQNGGGGGGGACSVSTGADGTPVYDGGTSWGTTGTGVGDPPPPDPTPDPPDPTPPDPTPPDPTPPPLPPPAPVKAPGPKLPPCNDPSNNRSRFFQQLPGLTSVAKQLNVSTNFIVGLSSYESGWFDNHNFNLNNLWGLTQAGHNNISFSSVQAGNAYFVSLVGPYIQGAQTITGFFAGLQEEGYNSTNPNYFNTDPNKGMLSNRISNIQKWGQACGVSF